MRRVVLLVVLALLVAGCGSSNRCANPASKVVLRVEAPGGKPPTLAALHQARQYVADRLLKTGAGKPHVSTRGPDEIIVVWSGQGVGQLPQLGRLQIWDFENDLVAPTIDNGNPTPYASLYSLLSAVKGEASSGRPTAYYLFDGTHRIIGGPDPTEKSLLAPYAGDQPNGSTILAVPAGREAVSGPSDTAATRPVGRSRDGQYWYLLRWPSEIGYTDLKRSAIAAEYSEAIGSPEVRVGFTHDGAKAFQLITKAEYDRGRLVAGFHGSPGRLDPLYAQHNAIVLDDKLIATPYVDYTESALSLGIAGGQAVIGNLASLEKAKDLARVLGTGPLTFTQISLKAVCVSSLGG